MPFMSVLKISKQDLIHYKVNCMTSEEYEKEKAALDREFTFRKGKLAEEYLKYHGVLDENGLPTKTKLEDMSVEALKAYKDRLYDLLSAINAEIIRKDPKSRFGGGLMI